MLTHPRRVLKFLIHESSLPCKWLSVSYTECLNFIVPVLCGGMLHFSLLVPHMWCSASGPDSLETRVDIDNIYYEEMNNEKRREGSQLEKRNEKQHLFIDWAGIKLRIVHCGN